MPIKELAFSTQKQLKSSTGYAFKRAHSYELLAAAFGFDSYAAFTVDSVFTQQEPNHTHDARDSALIKQRCIELGCPPDKADAAVSALETLLTQRQLGVTRISALPGLLREGRSWQDDDPADSTRQAFADNLDAPAADRFPPLLLAGLDAAANKGSALAHYALALIHAPRDEDDDREASLNQVEKYTRHLREAGRLGNRHALLDLAERFDDPSFFEQPRSDIDADPAVIAAIAEGMGRTADAKYWLTVAARGGDTDAMLQLIEEHDRANQLRCWTWVYLAQLLGTDLTSTDMASDVYYAINENGSDYDDDVGGPAWVAGRDGINLVPLSAEQDAIAREVAQDLFELLPQADE